MLLQVVLLEEIEHLFKLLSTTKIIQFKMKTLFFHFIQLKAPSLKVDQQTHKMKLSQYEELDLNQIQRFFAI